MTERNDARAARHIAVDTPCNLLALPVTPANEQDRAQVGELAQSVQAVTGEAIEVAFANQGYAGEVAATHRRGLR